MKKEIEKNENKDVVTEKTVRTKKQPKAVETIYIELLGKQIDLNKLTKRAEADFLKLHKEVMIKDIKIYINVSEGVAYYVVNGIAEDEFKISL